MFNPYFEEPAEALRPVPERPGGGLLEGFMERLSRLDTDDLLILLLIYLVVKEEEQDGIWPIAAALLYLIL